MPKDVLARVFEPFYTTKEVGKGSGLGLSQVYGFARQSGGHISIQSVVGEGTVVRLCLPWTEPADSRKLGQASASYGDRFLLRAFPVRQLIADNPDQAKKAAVMTSRTRTLSQAVRRFWFKVIGQKDFHQNHAAGVFVHDPGAQRPHDLDDPFHDPKVQARVGEMRTQTPRKNVKRGDRKYVLTSG